MLTIDLSQRAQDELPKNSAIPVVDERKVHVTAIAISEEFVRAALGIAIATGHLVLGTFCSINIELVVAQAVVVRGMEGATKLHDVDIANLRLDGDVVELLNRDITCRELA